MLLPILCHVQLVHIEYFLGKYMSVISNRLITGCRKTGTVKPESFQLSIQLRYRTGAVMALKRNNATDINTK